jgi:formate dehydrogenase major subunit
MEPLGEARPDWQILTELARRLGADWGYTHPSQIMDEVAGIAEMFAGVSYDRLEGWQSLQWPVAADGTDTPFLYAERFHFPDGKARLHPIEWRAPTEQPDQEYDLMLDNGRLLEHFQSINQTGRVPGIVHEVPEWFVEVGQDLAAARGIEDGDWLRVSSRRASVEVKALVTDRVSGNILYMPIHHAKPAANLLTSSHVDDAVHTPAYKETAVRIERLGRKDHPPLDRNNFRYGQPTPALGVETDRKWARADYVEPPAKAPSPERF